MFFKGIDKDYWNSLLSASLIGIHLVMTSVLGLALGYFLDKWLETTPWLTMVFFFLGVVAGFKNMFQEVKKLSKKNDAQKNQPKDG